MRVNQVQSIHQNKLINSFISLLILSQLQAIKGDTFENVIMQVKWHSHSTDTREIKIISDNYIRNYVGEFGEVTIQNQYIPQLVKLSVSNLPKATHIALTNCKIRKIAPGSFQNLPQLIDLNLSENLLEEIENGVFDKLNFKSLYLDNNRIFKIGNQAFNNLQMEYLFIDNNRIREWRNDWFLNTPLTSISISNNLIKKFPRLAFEYLWHFQTDAVLRNLNLFNNQLEHIDPDTFTGIKIILTLNLQNNSLIYLEPGLFDTVRSIDQIDLSSNKITQIYFETFRNTKIESLNIYDNFVSCIPTEILQNSQIKEIKVGKNPISCQCKNKWTQWLLKNKKTQINGLEALQQDCRSLGNYKKPLEMLIYLVILSSFCYHLSINIII